MVERYGLIAFIREFKILTINTMYQFKRCNSSSCELKYNCFRYTEEKVDTIITLGYYEDGSQFCNYFLNPLTAQEILNVEENARPKKGEIKP